MNLSNRVKQYIESHADNLDKGNTPFLLQAAKDLASPEFENLISAFVEADMDFEYPIVNFLAANAIFESTNFKGVTMERGTWAKWLEMGYRLGHYKIYADAALQLLPNIFKVFENPYGWEGDHDYLILDKNTSLEKWVEANNQNYLDQTGEDGRLIVSEFKPVTLHII